MQGQPNLLTLSSADYVRAEISSLPGRYDLVLLGRVPMLVIRTDKEAKCTIVAQKPSLLTGSAEPK